MIQPDNNFYAVLKALHGHHLTTELILVGGWCPVVYQHHFNDEDFPVMQTQDIDLLITNPFPCIEVDLDTILTDLGFLKEFSSGGYTRYLNESLEIEFLTPEKGGTSDRPIPVKRLNVAAQALRFMDIIQRHTVIYHYFDIPLKLPHPCAFALVKLLVSKRRTGSYRDKAEKDILVATGILEYLAEHLPDVFNETEAVFADLSQKLRNEIIAILESHNPTLKYLLNGCLDKSGK